MHEIIITPERSKGTISKNIYGHFSEHLGRCIYQGIFVGKESAIPNKNGMRTDVIEALKKIEVPVLRWPGGCFADEYHWQDGIGTQENRKRMVNTNWGGVVEDNSFGTHEFMELCEQIGCEPYINANVGSGTVREMAEWVEYLNSAGDSSVVKTRWANGRKEPWGVKYWGVGNESWGCGGNMRPEYYADEFRRYQTYCRNYGEHKLYRIACGANVDDYHWTQKVMEIAGRYMDAITLHYYTVPGDPWDNRGGATQFDTQKYYKTLARAWRMEELVSNHLQIMNRYDPAHRIGLIVDEWGTWYDVEPGTNPGFLYQQNTMRDALVAAITLNIFNKHCDRVVMANLAQTVNVLQAVILTDGDQMVLTPTYHVFDLYKAHQDAQEADCFIKTAKIGEGEFMVDQISASASKKDGALTITLANADCLKSADICLRVEGIEGGDVQARVLSGEMGDYNDFGSESHVSIHTFEGTRWENGLLRLEMPPCAVMEMRVTPA